MYLVLHALKACCKGIVRAENDTPFFLVDVDSNHFGKFMTVTRIRKLHRHFVVDQVPCTRIHIKQAYLFSSV
jgi:hypothetical protein